MDDDVVLQLGDRVHVYSQPEDAPALQRVFEGGTELGASDVRGEPAQSYA